MQTIKKISLNGSLILTASILSVFLVDAALGFLKFPTEVSKRIAHPRNHEEIRRSIEFQYVFKTNSRGLRYHDIPVEKPENARFVFVSGDSFTEGVGVNDGERFSDILEDRFRSSVATVRFINGGLAGTGPLAYGKLFLEIGLEYKPDALLICLFVNDVANTPEKLSPDPFASTPRTGFSKLAHDLFPRVYTQLAMIERRRAYHSRTKTSDFILTISERARKMNISQSQIDQWARSLPQDLVSAINQGTFDGSILAYGLLYPEYWTDSIDILTTKAKKKWENVAYILAELNRQSKQHGVETAVVLIPSMFQYDPKSHNESNPWIVGGTRLRKEWLSEDTAIQKRVRFWALSEGVPFLDLTPVFREAIRSNKSLNWELDGHWNSQGHLVAASSIEAWLVVQQVFSFMKRESVTNY